MKELLLSGEQTKKDVCDLYVNKGLNIRKISDIYCVSEYTVRLRLKSWGVRLRRPGLKFGEVRYQDEQDEIANGDVRKDICKRYKRGESTYDIAKVYGVAGPTIRYRLKAWGVKLRTQGGSNTKLTVTKKWYNDLMKENGTYASIAEKYGVSAPTVSKLKNGYKPNFKKG